MRSSGIKFELIAVNLLIAIVLVIGGCGGNKIRLYDQPSLEIKDQYEQVWVEPQIVYSDSVVTLIRADRVDSILIRSSSPAAPPGVQIAFHISEEICNVSVNLADSGGRLLRPIFVQRLEQGHYQLTLHYPSMFEEINPLESYRLEADYCGERSTTPFIADR